MDVQEIIHYAVKTDTALEINASPERMDLNDIYTKSAKEQGVKLSIGSDAHQTISLSNMYYSVSIARRGWLERGNLLNSLTLKELKSLLRKTD